MVKERIQPFLVLLLLLPLLFLNLKTSHDWGDDFAQYIHQAQNLLEGKSQNETGVVFNETHFIGPVAYPIGFPIILAPVLKSFGYNLLVLNVYLSAFLVLSCFLGFIFLRRRFSFHTALITILIIAYNPIMLSLKTEVLSDLPYLFFSLLSLWLITSKRLLWQEITLGISIALSVHIRSVGFILLFIYVLSFVFNYTADKKKTGALLKQFVFGVGAFLVIYIALKIAIPCTTNYPFPIEISNFWNNSNAHLNYNLDNLFAFFKKFNGSPFSYIGLVAACTLISFSIIGMAYAWKSNKKDLVNYYVLVYTFIIITLKFGDAGFRFILPILFFIFYYAILALSKCIENMGFKKNWLPFLVGALCIFSYKPELTILLNTKNDITEGPEKPDAKKMFEYINANLTPNDIIEFEKPRVIALYTKTKSVAILPVQSEQMIKSDLKKIKATYVLVHYILTDQPIRQYTQNPANGCVSVYKLNDLELFKVN